MEAVYNGHDAFVWLPTGNGKSLCDQAVPLIMDYKLWLVGSQKHSLMLVVSPVTALMVDQVTSLKKGSVYCSVVTSSAWWYRQRLYRNRQKPTVLCTRSFSPIEVEVLHRWCRGVTRDASPCCWWSSLRVQMASHTLMHVANIHLFKQAWNVSYHNIIHVRKLCCEWFIICLNWTPCYNIQLGTQIRLHLMPHYTGVYWLVSYVFLNVTGELAVRGDV